MNLTSTENATEFMQWKVDNTVFSIEPAQVGEESSISKIAKAAYFHPDVLKYTNRDPEQKETYKITGSEIIKRRLEHPEAYAVLVCKVHTVQQGSLQATKEDSGSEKQIIGTVYYQFKNTDFKEGETELAELGLLAVDPKFWGKKYSIGSKLVDSVFELAQRDKVRALYIYAIGSRSDAGEHSNHLLDYYQKKGFQHVTPWKSQNTVYTTPGNVIDMVVMLKQFSEAGSRVNSITSSKQQTYPIS